MYKTKMVLHEIVAPNEGMVNWTETLWSVS